MRQIFFSLFFLFISNLSVAQYPDNGIGDTIHAIHYSISLNEINTSDETIDGHAEVMITPLVNNLQNIPLELKSLNVDSVFVNNIIVPFSHEGEIVRAELSEHIGITDTVLVTIYYQGKPFSEAWGGFHFDEDYAFNLGVGFESIPHNLGKTWFPCIDDFTDRATYDFYVVADDDKKAICGGSLIDTLDNGNGTKTWHWKLAHPIPTYLASVAIGNYMLFSDEFIGLQDTVPIQIYTRPSEINNVAGTFVHLKEILQWYEQSFGPYPFSRVGYTGTKTGAMEHATNIAFPHFAIDGFTGYESLYTHELAHMWFGDKVTCSSAEDMWLNEGWATFCEIMYLQDIYGYENFINTMRHHHQDMLRTAHKKDGGYYALNNIPQEITYGRHAYDKGGSVANTLRGYLGDTVFFDAMTAFLGEYGYESVSSEDLRDFLTDYTGIDMTAFFDAWVMTPGTPHFSIDSTKITDVDTAFMVDIWVRQKYKGVDFLADENILDISFANNEFVIQTDSIHFSGKTGHSVKYIDFEPKTVFLDLYERINDATSDLYRVFNAPVEYNFNDTYFRCIIDEITDSALIRVTHNWVGPDSLKTPIDGLRISPNRYWTIEAIYPNNIAVRGKFQYKTSGYMDNELILSDSDSVVVLYRENSSEEWHEIPQTRTGDWRAGFVTTEGLPTGEYTVAVWDKTTVDIDTYPTNKIVNIYPNPTRGKLNFKFENRGSYNILIYDIKGAQLGSFSINGKSKSWKWDNQFAFNGVVFVHVYEGRKLLTVKKVVFTQ